MRSNTKKHRQHLAPRRAGNPGTVAGQSIPLLAIMLVVLLGMVGLSVDVGNTYQEQRELVRTTNAASMSAMETYLQSGRTDDDIAASIRSVFTENGIEAVSWGTPDLSLNQRWVRATYMDSQGNPLALCEIGECPFVPSDVWYIQVESAGDVDTYFARALGQEQLPVNTRSFAGSCPPNRGVFPIGVNMAVLNDQLEFKDADGSVTLDVGLESDYKFKQLTTGDPIQSTTDVGMLRWEPGNSPNDIPAMLTSPGTLELGFREAPWSDTPETKPSDYPSEPTRLTSGEWTYGFAQSDDLNEFSWLDSNITAKLDQLAGTSTRMILPIYEFAKPVDRVGPQPAFYVIGFGVFYVYVDDSGGGSYGVNGDGDTYITLISAGEASNVPCIAGNVVGPDKYGVEAAVHVLPRWGEVIRQEEGDIKPAGYTIVLDVSGSMSFSIDGLGTWLYGNGADGRDYQCVRNDPSIPLPYMRDAHGSSCEGGHKAPWRYQDARRIFEAREAIIDLIEGMLPEDQIRVVTFNSNERSSFNKWYLPDDPELRDDVRTTGQCCTDKAPSPSYLTSGGTSGADGLERAQQWLTASDWPTHERDGETRENRRVIVYMTDGVSNQIMNGGGSSPGRPECSGLGSSIVSTAFCHIGYAEDGRELPIQSMIRLSNEMHTTMRNLGEDDFVLFILAMGFFDSAGLLDVATAPDKMYHALDAGAITDFLQKISTEVKFSECASQKGDYVNFIGDAHRPYFSPGFIAQNFREKDRNQYGDENIFGYAIIERDNQEITRAPIIQTVDKGLHFSVPPEEGLVPGQYTLTVWVGYNAGAEAQGTRIYDQIIDVYNDYSRLERIGFSVSDSVAGGPLGDTIQINDIYMDIADSVDVCD